MQRKDILLAIDTSAAHCAAALLWGRQEPGLKEISDVKTHAEVMEKGQAERLAPMIQEMLQANQTVWSDVTGIVVGIGPGNFTGIRIAVSMARGLALGLGVPAVGVSCFETVAMGLNPPFPYWILHDAPRGQFYGQRFPNGTPQLLSAEDCNLLDASCFNTNQLSPAHFVGAMACYGYKAGMANKSRPAPLYIRPADAAPPSDPPPLILP